MACLLVSCTANRYAREHPYDPMCIKELPVVVHLSDVVINLINVNTYPDSLTGDIPRFRTAVDKTDAMHLFLADDFKIAPDATRLVIPHESVLESKVMAYKSREGVSTNLIIFISFTVLAVGASILAVLW